MYAAELPQIRLQSPLLPFPIEKIIKEVISNIMENDLSDIIKEWVTQNKTAFWKYEVSFYYKPYKVTVNNLPNPSKDDIVVLPHNRDLNSSQKTKLCNAIIKAYAKKEAPRVPSINVNIDYSNGMVAAAVI